MTPDPTPGPTTTTAEFTNGECGAHRGNNIDGNSGATPRSRYVDGEMQRGMRQAGSGATAATEEEVLQASSVRGSSRGSRPQEEPIAIEDKNEGTAQGQDDATAIGYVPWKSLAKDSDAPQKVSKNRTGVYRYGMLALWLGSSAIIVLDRFYWNVWPRQTICAPGCGNDFYCDMDEDPGCLKRGPWSVKMFDAIARISARLIISTTSLLFSTMCHGTWNYLSEVAVLRPYLYAWRGDNSWLHSIGGWTIGIWTILHVWSLLFPSIFHGFTNVNAEGWWEWFPTQVAMSGGNVDVDAKTARWSYDDIWRIFWMTIIFGGLLPLSRSTWALTKNFSLAMALHSAVGAGVFYDSWRRKTHPHVWILNTPVFLWYAADKIWCATRGRVDPMAEATRVALDEDYMLLLWKHVEEPKRICDIFWLKHSQSVGKGKGKGMTGEMAHPFTTCSSHNVDIAHVPRADAEEGDAVQKAQQRPTIEIPAKTDVSWPGHRFSLLSAALSALSRVSTPARDIALRHDDPADKLSAFDSSESASSSPAGSAVSQESHVPALAELSCYRSAGKTSLMTVDRPGEVQKPRTPGAHGVWSVPVTPAQESQDAFFPVTPTHGFHPRGLRLASEPCIASPMEEEKSGFEHDKMEETMIGADTGCRPGETTLYLGGPKSCVSDTARRVVVPSSVRSFVPEERIAEVGGTKRKNARKKGLKRLDTTVFEEFRNKEAEEGRMGHVAGGAWDKMAIVKIHRRKQEATVRSCSCLGMTTAISWFRQPHTASIADLEAGKEGASVPLRTYGPYRSEYGRLSEFPNLPPLLVIATGAGAALALDFVAYVRANGLQPKRPVKVCYSSASLALLQFVTNTLLAESTPGIHIKTALTRHDDLQVFDTTADSKEHLGIGRLDVSEILGGVSSDTEVYFCGGGAINAMLRAQCAERGMKYAGSSVQ